MLVIALVWLRAVKTMCTGCAQTASNAVFAPASQISAALLLPISQRYTNAHLSVHASTPVGVYSSSFTTLCIVRLCCGSMSYTSRARNYSDAHMTLYICVCITVTVALSFKNGIQSGLILSKWLVPVQ